MIRYMEDTPDFELVTIREFVGMAAKYLVLERDWDFAGHIPGVERFGVTLTNHPIVQAVFGGFNGIRAADMRSNSKTAKLLVRMAGLSGHPDPLERGRRRWRTRRKWLGRYGREMRVLLRDLRLLRDLDGDAPAGVRYSVESIKVHFLPSRATKRGES